MGTWGSKQMLFFYSKWNIIRYNMVSTPQVCVLFSQSRQWADYWSESQALLPEFDSGPPVPKRWKTELQEQDFSVLKHIIVTIHMHAVWFCEHSCLFSGGKLVRDHVPVAGLVERMGINHCCLMIIPLLKGTFCSFKVQTCTLHHPLPVFINTLYGQKYVDTQTKETCHSKNMGINMLPPLF